MVLMFWCLVIPVCYTDDPMIVNRNPDTYRGYCGIVEDCDTITKFGDKIKTLMSTLMDAMEVIEILKADLDILKADQYKSFIQSEIQNIDYFYKYYAP